MEKNVTKYNNTLYSLKKSPKTWLITGVAGFIGSNLLENLLALDQHVVGLDNFATGHQRNLDEVQSSVSKTQWDRFTFNKGDIRDIETCRKTVEGVDYVLHQAALGSVPRSLVDPIATNAVNITGFLNMLISSRDAGVKRFVYAASSSTYGDHPELPKKEENIGHPLSPYAVTKLVNEQYADVFARCYNLTSTGLRYFNVFGRRQDPDGAYAAVIPKWISAMLSNEDVIINGDGTTSRDFCYIDNVVQMNILAATSPETPGSEVYNVAVGGRTSLNELFSLLQRQLNEKNIQYTADPVYKDFRAGDVKHSQADISKAQSELGYNKFTDIEQGIAQSLEWYISFFKRNIPSS